MKTVSIIIPCYNDGRFISEAVRSAQAQTYKLVEIIVVDDHSTDSHTLGVLEKLKREGISVLRTAVGKKGPSSARNTAIAQARGEYILPLDADDRIAPMYVEKALEALEADERVGICYCRAELFGQKRGEWRLPEYSFEGILCENMIFATALYRKADWMQVGGYDESLQLGLEDYAFWLRLLALGRQVVQLDEVLFYYRIKPCSRSAMLEKNQVGLRSFEQMVESCQEIFRDNVAVIAKQMYQLKIEREQRECLLSWKLFAPLFRLEWRVRQFLKRLIGRA